MCCGRQQMGVFVASLMETLIDVLEQESGEYQGLLKLSMDKTQIIVKGDLEQLQKITEEEQEAVGRITRLEHMREETTADIANVLNKDVSELKLTSLIQMMEGKAEQKSLSAAHTRLKETIQQLHKVNEQNGALIRNALELVEFDLNLMQAAKLAPETANYNKGAYSAGNTMAPSRSGFDAKQ